MTTGAINHWAFDTPDIEAAFENAKALGVDFKDTEIQSNPEFLEAWHPLLQHLRPQRRDHRILPDCGGVVAPMRPIRAQYACR